MTSSSRPRAPLPPAGTAVVTVLASLLFAVSFGFNYGIGNQTAYLLPALRLLDPELFARDWAVSSATQYHQAYAYLAAPLLAADPRGWAVAVALTVTVLIGGLALQALCQALVGPRLGLPSFLLLVALLLLTRTMGPAGAYVFDGTFQPSTLSNALLLGAVAGFAGGHRRISGVLIALSGLFHVNFALLTAAAFGIAELSLGRKELTTRLLQQLGPAALVLLSFLPTLQGAASSGPDAALGRFVYLYVRAPHHFVLSDKLPEFLPLAGWAFLAWGVTRPLAVGEGGLAFRRLGACAFGLVAIVGLGAGAALASDGARALFSWRLAPAAEVVLQAGVMAGVAQIVTEPDRAGAFDWKRVVTIGIGVALTFAGWAAQDRIGPIQVVAVIGAGVAACLLAGRRRAPAATSAQRERWRPRALTALAVLLLVGFALRPLGRVPRRSNLLTPAPSAERALFRWMQQGTDKSALFLVPPELDGVRLFAQRSVVIDWKNNPAVPTEVLAWYRRLEDITGRPGFRSVDDLAGYDALDPERFERLRSRYGFDFAVLHRGRERLFPGYEVPYQNEDFVVLRSRTP